MLTLIHVVIALSSLAFTTYLYFLPARSKFKVSYTLIAGTLISGTVLVIFTHSPLLSSCVMGLVYLCFVSLLMVATHRKLAVKEVTHKTD